MIGHSLGSQTAFYFATLYASDIKAVSIVAGFDSVYNLCKATLNILGFLCLAAWDHFDNIKLSQKYIDTNYYQFHKKNDAVIPFERGKALFDVVNAKNKEFIELTDGNHGRFNIAYVIDYMISRN